MRGLVLRRKMWWYQFVPYPGAKLVRVSTGRRNESEAITQAMEIKRRYQADLRGTLAHSEAEIENYLSVQRKAGLSKSTIQTREYVLKAFVKAVGAESPNRITTAAVESWHEKHLKDNAHTAVYYLQMVKHWFAWLLERGKIATSPAAFVKPPKRLRMRLRRVFLLPAQSRKLIARPALGEFPNRFNGQKAQRAARLDALQFICFCGLHAGLRKLEVVEAAPDWFDVGARLIHVQATETFEPKDRDNRTIPMTDEFATFLKGYMAKLPGGAKFMLMPAVKHGKARYRYDFRKLFEKHVKELGFPEITFHDLRRTFASQLVSHGVSIYKVAKWLGDIVSVVEERYGHLIPQDTEINVLGSGVDRKNGS